METIVGKLVVAVVAAVIVGIVGLFATKLFNWLFPKLRNWWSRRMRLINELEALQGRLDNGLSSVALIDRGAHKIEGNGLWLAGSQGRGDDQIYHSNLTRSIPIWVFANLKGGVGKTTNATNIAGHYALQIQDSIDAKPVLLIDLDYQGSASSMSLSISDHVPPGGFDSHSTRLIRGDFEPADIVAAPLVQKEGLLSNLKMRVIPSHYDLAKAENRIMIEWLFGENPTDVRYTLANLLHQPVVQENFSRIIIDAPPRLTTACIQALCAATHVVIPTILDRLSSEAVGTFVDQVEILKSEGVCPHIKYGGIIGYRPGNPSQNLPAFVQTQLSDAKDKICDALRGNGLSEELYIDENVLTHHPLLAESAGQYIATLRTNVVRQQHLDAVQEMFRQLAGAIEARIR